MKKALIVIDMQNDFIDGSLGSEEAVKIIPSVIDKIKNWDGHIIVTLDTHKDDYMDTLEGKMLPVKHCIEGTEGWEIREDIMDAIREKSADLHTIITKPTFGSIRLPDFLNESFDEIQIIGLCTDICVISNALILRANYPNMKIICDAKCCAGVTPEKHMAALEVMKSCQIEVINER